MRIDSLKDFDSLPDSASVRVPVVAAVLGCSVPTIWRYARDGAIPKPRKAGKRITVWNVGELRAYKRRELFADIVP